MNETSPNIRIFTQRIDIYGQALAIYVVILVVLFIFKGSLEAGEYSIALFNPLIVLMVAIVLLSAIMLIIAALKRKQIILFEDTIEIKNRFHSKKFKINDIRRIKITNSPTKLIKGEAGFVRIKLKNKKKIIFIRTAPYNNNIELLNFFIEIRNTIINKK